MKRPRKAKRKAMREFEDYERGYVRKIDQLAAKEDRQERRAAKELKRGGK